MSVKLDLVVGEGETGSRLDVFLSSKSALSRSQWQSAIRAGQVKVNQNQVSSVATTVGLGDKISGHYAEKPGPSLTASQQNLPIIYEDGDTIVIDKPAGLLTHPASNASPSVAGSLAGKIEPDGTLRPGVVHRLDRDTSGVMILAKNQSSKDYLAKQFAKRQVEKTYLALISGRPKHDEASIEVPIERDKRRGDRWRVGVSGRKSTTQYKVLHYYRDMTLVKVKPLTGRTHQIRVHFAHLGHPVVGDKIYGKKITPQINRQFLHASSLVIKLPNGKKRKFEADLPPELVNYLEQIDV